MAVRFRIASLARGFVLAGLAWIVVSGDMAVLGADPSSLKGASLRGLDGKRVDLAAPPSGATVLVFYSTECPISNSYSPTLSTLIDLFPAKSVKWIGICVDPDLSDSEVGTHARDFSLKFPVVHDRRGTFARKIGAKMTPETFVIDKEGSIRYHGRIDDQFVARRVRNAVPSGNELKDAIAAVLNGKEVKAPYVEAVGCPLPEAPAVAAKPTYCKDVAPILQKTARNVTVLVRSVRSPWKLMSKHGNARPISRTSSRTALCRPGRQRPTSASR
jgi:alkyl hydroperoxide reductase subunit AhpC